MPLSLHCGPFSYLEESFVSRLTANPPGAGRRVGVVTASQQMAERLQRLLALERGLAFFNLRFLTFHTLSIDVLRSARVPLPAVVNDDLFHERLVERLLLEGSMPAERARALAGAHRATLRDLVEAGVEGASFREHFSDLERADRGKLDRLLALADAYRDRLEKLNVAGSADLARRAAGLLDERPDLLAGYDEFLYYGFYDLNGAQSDFFSAVVRSAPVRLYFPCVRGSAGWAFAERFLELKLPLGGAEIAFGTAPAPGVLGAVADQLFEPGRTPESPAAPAQIISVSGERDEIARVAKEIVRLREASPPVDWDDVGVVARGLEGYSGLVREIFSAHGIPFSLSDGGPLLADPAARLALQAAEIRFRGHSRDALADLLSSPLLLPDVFSPDDLQAARDHLAQAGPRAGFFYLMASSPHANRSLRELTLRLKPDLPEGVHSWTAHGTSLRRRLGRLMEPASAAGFSAVAEIIDRLAELDRFSPPIAEEEYASAFADALGRARGAGTGAVHGVRVRGAMDARGEPFRVLFLVGLKEGVFPRVVREDPLLSDDLRRFLRDPGGYWILPKRDGHDEEKLLFTLLVSAAQDKLYFLYSRSRDNGRAEVPSLYLRNAARALGADLESAERMPRAPLEKWKAFPPSLLLPSEAALVDVLEDRSPAGPLGDQVRRAEKLAAWGTPGPWDGEVGPPAVFLERCSGRGLSPSAVETLASCPFEFFLSKLMDLRDPRPGYDEEGLLPAMTGTLQHEALRDVYGDFIKNGLPDPDTAAGRVRPSVETVFAARALAGAGPYPLLWKIAEDRVVRRLADFVRRDVARLRAEGARPERVEWPLAAPLAGTSFRWTGRLDRVDWNPSTRQWTVVDYKNRKRKEPLLKRIIAGQVHQAPAYLEMVSALTAWGPGAAPAGVRYEALDTNESEEFTAEAWALHGPALVKTRVDLLAAVRDGHFPIHPSEGPGGHCGYCDFARACRKAHGPSRRRSEGADAPRARP